ncbi:MAG: flagellar M-ring protein FliF [Rhodospirillales bacterium]|jgi:flagellar M-ring protein FliF|nr:flagellar M-ring protein FliF [Rhodospirillales bacterium]
MDAALKLIRSFGPVRAAALATGLLTSVAIIAWLLSRVSMPDMALLYGDLDVGDAARIVEHLEAGSLPYDLRQGGTAVYVAASSVPRLRIALAEQGLPSGGATGYELFDTAPTLGTTNFMQDVNLVRALEGELVRSIRSMDAVQAVRVHLVLPKREMFSREREQPSASVLLRTRANQPLPASQVLAIQHLVASAVAGLDPGHVSIVDGRGSLLTRAGDGDSATAFASGNEERQRRFEDRLRHTVEQLLERTLGAGKVRAEVSAEMDFDRINTSEELFDPESQVVRSTQTIEESNSSKDADADPPVTVAANLPDPGIATGPGRSSSSAENRTEETVNYEISKKVVNHVREVGIIRRLSVAVLVDGAGGGEGAAATYQPRSQDELERIATLVRGAIGFDPNRGDRVEVINMQFAAADVPDAEPAPFLGLGRAEMMQIAQSLGLVLLGGLILLVVVRPLLNRALEASRAAAPTAAAMPALAAGVALPALPAAEPEMIDIDRVEGQVKASILRTVGDIVDKHPEESLAIVRGWLHAES